MMLGHGEGYVNSPACSPVIADDGRRSMRATADMIAATKMKEAVN